MVLFSGSFLNVLERLENVKSIAWSNPTAKERHCVRSPGTIANFVVSTLAKLVVYASQPCHMIATQINLQAPAGTRQVGTVYGTVPAGRVSCIIRPRSDQRPLQQFSQDRNIIESLLFSQTMNNQSTSQALIRTTPAVKDKRELESIITTSLIRLFGDCQPYSCGFSVLECRPSSDLSIRGQHPSYDAIVECSESSMEYIRAALTFSSVPSFLEGEVYRLDFIQEIQKKA